jgi:hypothetical protein
MPLVEIVNNYGEAAQKVEPFYNEPWFSGVLSAIATLAAASVAIYVIKYDHQKQKETRGEQKRKEISDLKNYFFEIGSALLEAVKEQMEVYESILSQLKETKYGPITRKNIPSLNLDKIYYLTPGQMFEVFVTERGGDSKENAKKLIEIFKTFDRIQGIKDLDAASSKMVNEKIERLVEEFFHTVQKIDTLKREVVHTTVTPDSGKVSIFISELTSLFSAYKVAANYDIKDSVEDPKDTNGNPTNRIIITDTELLDKLVTLFNQDDNIFNNYRFQFLDLINNAKISLSELRVILKHLEVVTTNYLESLGKVKDTLEKELPALK